MIIFELLPSHIVRQHNNHFYHSIVKMLVFLFLLNYSRIITLHIKKKVSKINRYFLSYNLKRESYNYDIKLLKAIP